MTILSPLVENATCPICLEPTSDGACEKHGKRCNTCHTFFKTPSCESCFPLYQESSKMRRRNEHALRLGELAFGPREFSLITGRRRVSRIEVNMLRAACDGDPFRKKIRQNAERATRWLNLPRNTESDLVDRVERNASLLASALKSDATSDGRKIHVSLEKIVEYFVLAEAKRIGRTILEVQRALASAKFNVKLHSVYLRIAVLPGVDISSVKIYVNDWKDQRDFRASKLSVCPGCTEYTLNLPLYLSDTLDQRGTQRNWLTVRVENARFTPQSSRSAQSEKRKRSSLAKIIQRDSHTLFVRANSEKCFSLFKDINRILDKISPRETNQINSSLSQLDGSLRRHLSPFSTKFPASTSLLRRASCLAKFERVSASLFRDLLRNSKGRSNSTLAREALLGADQQVFTSLPPLTKLAMKSYVSTLPLKRRDRVYTGINGLLLPSELFPA